MKSLLYISILLITACNLSAQQVIKGTVTDAGNGQPVDAATVQIRKTGRQLPLTYTLTKADGTFILPLHQADDSLFVHVSLLGYKAIRQKITAGTRLLIRLEPEIFTLKGSRYVRGASTGNTTRSITTCRNSSVRKTKRSKTY